MCGRFTLTKSPAEIIDYLQSLPLSINFDRLAYFTPQYNIAPTHNILTIVQMNQQWECHFFRWGLIPSWWTTSQINNKPLINARRETLAEKASFKNALFNRRCLIIADGFYEWNHSLYGKNPLYFQLANQQIFAFASLWESWQESTDSTIYSTTIINTSAQGTMKTIHPRMPVVLNDSALENWLNPTIPSSSALNSLLEQNSNHNFHFFPVSEQVNYVKNNYPDLLQEQSITITKQLSLF